MNETIPVRIPGGEDYVYATVDAADAPRLRQYSWVLSNFGHATRHARGETLSMQRDVTGCVYLDGRVVHHINEEKLDNRFENLDVCDGQADHMSRPHPRTLELKARNAA